MPIPGADPHEVVEYVVDGDELVGAGGFLKLRRLHLRNRRADGTLSRGYISDSVARPYGQDAVIVAIYARHGDGDGDGIDAIDVLVRDQLRPAVSFGRDASVAPLPEAPAGMFATELVAGILETSDHGEVGLRARAAAETFEEAGFVVDPAAILLLGGGTYPSPGSMVEKFYFTAVEVDPQAQQPLGGDGSPMEEGARTRWMPFAAAIAACTSGALPDLKTEVGLRRLRDHLERREPAATAMRPGH